MTGLVTPNEIKGIAKARWPYTIVYDVMRPLEELKAVTPETPVSEALEILGRDDINQLPALTNGRLEGMISRDQILSLPADTRRAEDVTRRIASNQRSNRCE